MNHMPERLVRSRPPMQHHRTRRRVDQVRLWGRTPPTSLPGRRAIARGIVRRRWWWRSSPPAVIPVPRVPPRGVPASLPVIPATRRRAVPTVARRARVARDEPGAVGGVLKRGLRDWHRDLEQDVRGKMPAVRACDRGVAWEREGLASSLDRKEEGCVGTHWLRSLSTGQTPRRRCS